MRLTGLKADSRGTPIARGRQCKTSKKGQEKSIGDDQIDSTYKIDSTPIFLHKKDWWNPRSPLNQSSKPCTVLQRPSRKETYVYGKFFPAYTGLFSCTEVFSSLLYTYASYVFDSFFFIKDRRGVGMTRDKKTYVQEKRSVYAKTDYSCTCLWAHIDICMHFSWWVLQHCTGFARLVWGRLRVHRAFVYSDYSCTCLWAHLDICTHNRQMIDHRSLVWGGYD